MSGVPVNELLKTDIAPPSLFAEKDRRGRSQPCDLYGPEDGQALAPRSLPREERKPHSLVTTPVQLLFEVPLDFTIHEE